MDLDAPNRDSPPRQTPPDPEHPPHHTDDHQLSQAPPRSPPRQGPGHLPGWYRLQEGWTALTVKALQDLTTPEKGLREAIMDLVLWRARQHTQDKGN